MRLSLADRQLGVAEKLAAGIADPRDPRGIGRPQASLIGAQMIEVVGVPEPHAMARMRARRMSDSIHQTY